MSSLDQEDRLEANLRGIRQRMTAASLRAGRNPAETRLIGVTKTVDIPQARRLLELGVTDLGESRPQELWRKAAEIPEARWHFIGHMQRNKVEQTLPFIRMFHSVDSVRLVEALEAASAKLQRRLPFLLEFNISAEKNKQGFDPAGLDQLLEPLKSLRWLELRGLMGMAAQEEDVERCRGAFQRLRLLRDELEEKLGVPLPELSMGMSNDFEVAIEEGSTLVRVGSLLWS